MIAQCLGESFSKNSTKADLALESQTKVKDTLRIRYEPEEIEEVDGQSHPDPTA